MSIQFRDPMNEATKAKLCELFKNAIVALDEKTALVNSQHFNSRDLMDIARTAQQPLELNIYSDGETKTLSDGTQYRVTKKGWQKIAP